MSIPSSSAERGARRLWSPNVPFSPARWPFFYGWVVVAVGTLAVVASIPAQTMGVGVFTDVLLEELEISRLQLSLAYLAGTVGAGFLLASGGVLLDTIGLRKGIVFSAVFLGLALLILSQSDRLAHGVHGIFPAMAPWVPAFLVVTFGFFLIRFSGQGMLCLAARNLVGKWFNRKRGIAVGVSGVAASLAFSLSPTFLNILVDLFGWRESWILVGCFLLFGFSVFLWVFARDNPEECGLEMDGGKAPPGKENTNLDLVIYKDFTRREASGTFSFWCFNLSFAWHSVFFTAYTFHVVDIGRTLSMERAEMFILFFFAAWISIVTNLGAGWISEKIRLKWLLFVKNVSLLLMAMALFNYYPSLTKALIVVSLGISGGLFGNLSGNVYPRFFGRTHLGAITGLAMSMMVIASAIGPYLFSLLETVTGGYQSAFLLGVAVSSALIVASMWADNPQRALAPAGPKARPVTDKD